MAERRSIRVGARLRAGRALVALAFALPVSACYTYTQASPAAVAPGSSVRLRMTSQAALTVTTVPLPDGPRIIRGRLLPGSSPDTLVCAVPLSNADPLTPEQGLRGTVLVPAADVERLEVRRLQKGRTAAVLAGGAVLGLAVLEWAFNVTLPSQQGGGDSGGVNNVRRPLLRLRW